MVVGFGLLKFKEDFAQQGMAHLLQYLGLEKRYGGNLKGYVARALDDPTSFFIYTEWDSRESRATMHQGLRSDPEVGKLSQQILPLLVGEPLFGTFEVIE